MIKEFSPMMQQYLLKKEEYKDCILMYRLGDFYEMFFDDALLVSKLLGLTLTSRNDGKGGKTPMCGIPFHASENYIARLVSNGHKVAICEQLTEPTKGKQLVERDVIQVITAGTITNTNVLEFNKNNYVCAIYLAQDNSIGISWVDITTGEMFTKDLGIDADFSKLNDNLMMIRPSEIIANSEFCTKKSILSSEELGIIPKIDQFYDWAFTRDKCERIIQKQLNIIDISKLDIAKYSNCVSASGALLEYILQTQKKALSNIARIVIQKDTNYMYLDSISRRNLELVETMKDRKVKGSLLWVLDNTETAMGGRTLRKLVDQPLKDIDKINARLDAIEELTQNTINRKSLKELLGQISDVERMFGKVSNGSIIPKDCVSIKESLSVFPKLKKVLNNYKCANLAKINDNIFEFDDIVSLLDSAFDSEKRLELPSNIKEGGYIKSGFNSQLDEFRNMKAIARQKIAELEAREREVLNIKNIKISFNSVFGYYLEIPKSQVSNIPLGRYERRQTLANAERYTFEDLKKLEIQVLNSEENAKALELKIFKDIIDVLQNNMENVLMSARQIGILDAFVALAEVAVNNKYCKPELNNKGITHIENGRHPVVEKIKRDQTFIANDTTIDNEENKIMIITGPNMAGKSTYLRQVALITLLAHMGSFVPATKANISLTDRIFTRIGASDDLAQGQSTFMLEMLEVSNILANATKDSLVILDEVGRGTSTHDGLSIAWSLMEYLSNHNLGKVLFSTHYHELTELENKLKGVKNYQIAVKEFNNSIIFLRKIMRGGAQRSFGIEVGAMAGLPQKLIDRARGILSILEAEDINNKPAITEDYKVIHSKKCECDVCKKLSKITVDLVSPIEAFSILCDLKKLEEEGNN